MEFSTAYLKSEAKSRLQNVWGVFSLACVVDVLLAYAFTLPANLIENPVISIILQIAQFLILMPVAYSLSEMSLKVVNMQGIEFTDIFSGFQNYGKILAVSVVSELIVVLHMLLLIVPGIIKGYSYAMTNYVLAENPEMDTMDVLRESERMMKGHRWELFELQISFIGWILLSLVTLDISSVYSTPYMQSATAMFYCYLKELDGIQTDADEYQSGYFAAEFMQPEASADENTGNGDIVSE